MPRKSPAVGVGELALCTAAYRRDGYDPDATRDAARDIEHGTFCAKSAFPEADQRGWADHWLAGIINKTKHLQVLHGAAGAEGRSVAELTAVWSRLPWSRLSSVHSTPRTGLLHRIDGDAAGARIGQSKGAGRVQQSSAESHGTCELTQSIRAALARPSP